MKIVFLTYINRSGSTFLMNQMSKSPLVCICPEAEILYELFLTHPIKIMDRSHKNLKKIITLLSSDKKFSSWNLSVETINDVFKKKGTNITLFISLLKEYALKNNPEAELIIYKHTWSIKLISKLSNTIKHNLNLHWIILLRDIRAIYASQKRTLLPLTGKPMCTNWFSLIIDWNYFTNHCQMYKRIEKVPEVKYEDLINNPDAIIMKLTGYFNIPYEGSWIYDRKGKVYDLLPFEYQEIHRNIDLPPDRDHVFKWKSEVQYKSYILLTQFSKKQLVQNGYFKNENLDINYLHYSPEIIVSVVMHCLNSLKKDVLKFYRKIKHININQ